MSTPERQQDADPEKGVGYGAVDEPEKKGAEELERRRQSELSGQEGASQRKSDGGKFDESGPPKGTRSDAEQAKENERQSLETGEELPG